jgi:hypothetical protein
MSQIGSKSTYGPSTRLIIVVSRVRVPPSLLRKIAGQTSFRAPLEQANAVAADGVGTLSGHFRYFQPISELLDCGQSSQRGGHEVIAQTADATQAADATLVAREPERARPGSG